MDLFILRHGEAGKRIAPGHNDARRPLTVAGEQEITEIAEALERIRIRFVPRRKQVCSLSEIIIV